MVHPLVVLGYCLGSRWWRGQYLRTCCRRETVSGREAILAHLPWCLDIPTHNRNRCGVVTSVILAVSLFIVFRTGTPLTTTTSTALTTSPASPIAQGTRVALTATVTPAAATGTVQFKDGTTNIGNPVTVTNGTASSTTSRLTVGSHQLTAVFTPTDPAAYSPSTLPAVTFVVTAPTGR